MTAEQNDIIHHLLHDGDRMEKHYAPLMQYITSHAAPLQHLNPKLQDLTPFLQMLMSLSEVVVNTEEIHAVLTLAPKDPQTVNNFIEATNGVQQAKQEMAGALVNIFGCNQRNATKLLNEFNMNVSTSWRSLHAFLNSDDPLIQALQKQGASNETALQRLDSLYEIGRVVSDIVVTSESIEKHPEEDNSQLVRKMGRLRAEQQDIESAYNEAAAGVDTLKSAKELAEYVNRAYAAHHKHAS